jgi:hypothetical protein
MAQEGCRWRGRHLKARGFLLPHRADDRAIMGLRVPSGRSSRSVVGLRGCSGKRARHHCPSRTVVSKTMGERVIWRRDNQMNPILALVHIGQKSGMMIARRSSNVQESGTNSMSNRIDISRL